MAKKPGSRPGRTQAQIEAAERDGRYCLWCSYFDSKLVVASEVHHLAHRQPGADLPELCVNLCQETHYDHHNGFEPTTSQLLDLMQSVYGWNLRERFPHFFGKR